MQNKQTTTKGFAILSAAGIINKILALIYVPIQTHILGNYGNGIAGSGYALYMLIFSLTNAGIPSAISKLVSEQLTLRNYKNCQKIFKTAGLILLVFGAISSTLMALGAGLISKSMNVPDAYLMILALSPTLIFTSISSAFRGYFQGRSNMIPTAVSQILEQLINSTLTIVFAALLIKYGVDKAAAGTTVGTSMGALGAAMFLSFTYIRNRGQIYSESVKYSQDNNVLSFKDIIKEIALFSMPAVLGVMAINLYNIVDQLGIGRLVAGGFDYHTATVLYGIYSNQYQKLLNIPLALTVALPAALIPAVSGANASKNLTALTSKVNEGLRAAFILLIPSAMGMAVLAKPIITLIFLSTKLNQGSDLLTLGSWTIIIIAVNSIQSAVLIGAGKPYIAPVNMTIGLALKAIGNYYLVSIPALNMRGAVIASLIGYSTACLLNFIMIKRHLNISFRLGHQVIKIFIVSAVMGVFALISYILSHMLLSHYIQGDLILNDVCTLFSIFIGALVFAILAMKLTIIGSADILKLPFGNRINSIAARLGLLISSDL